MIAPWIVASWAPSICSREEDDGLTHFYLYFSNSGCGVGVITATSPTPFDPGVCIDENGTGWLSFGAGIAENGTKAMPGSARIVKLGKDMISFDSDFVEIKAPYIFEASELNYVNGTYVYTFNNSWECKGHYFKNPGDMGLNYSNNHTHYEKYKEVSADFSSQISDVHDVYFLFTTKGTC